MQKRGRRLLTRRRFLAGLGTAAMGALGGEGLWLEPRRLDVSQQRIGTGSDTARPLRLSVLTDLHLHSIGSLEHSVAEEIEGFRPDGILIVGDAIDRADALNLLRDFLGLLPPGTPKYATLGNWEHWCGVELPRLAAVYNESGGRLLVNESVRIPHDGCAAVLVGVDDLIGGRPDLDRAWQNDDGADALLLSHCPAYRDVLGAGARGLAGMLSGHTHGGQVALGPWAPFRPRGSGRYVAGWYRDGSVDLYVSRGIGTSVAPIRLGSVPELINVEWYLKAAWPGAHPDVVGS